MTMGYYFVGSRDISPDGSLLSSRLNRGRRPRPDDDMLRQLTARGDGGIDHGELCRSTCDPRQSRTHRAWNTHVGQPTAATHERRKINRTGDL